MALTDTAIRNAKPQAKQLKMADSGGLFLLVTPAGGKWWRQRLVARSFLRIVLAMIPSFGRKHGCVGAEEDPSAWPQGQWPVHNHVFLPRFIPSFR